MAKHGNLDPIVDIDLGGSTDITIILHYEHNTKSVLMSVNMHWKLAELRQKLRRRCGKVDKTVIYHQDIGCRYSPRLLNENQKTLGAYKVKDGDALYVGCKPEWQPKASCAL